MATTRRRVLFRKQTRSLTKPSIGKQTTVRLDNLILQHNNARIRLGKMVRTYLETLKCKVVSLYGLCPDIVEFIFEQCDLLF